MWLPGFHWAKSLHPSRCGAYVADTVANQAGAGTFRNFRATRFPQRFPLLWSGNRCGILALRLVVLVHSHFGHTAFCPVT